MGEVLLIFNINFNGLTAFYYRVLCTVCICLTLYGAGCVFIVLIGDLVRSLFVSVGVEWNLCIWMLIVAAAMTPLTWLGTPKDFW